MPFPNTTRIQALVRSRRHCCVCHEFAGRASNVHNIVQEAKSGPNTLENAICLCQRCHTEAGHYNPMHPLGTKYSPESYVHIVTHGGTAQCSRSRRMAMQALWMPLHSAYWRN